MTKNPMKQLAELKTSYTGHAESVVMVHGDLDAAFLFGVTHGSAEMGRLIVDYLPKWQPYATAPKDGTPVDLWIMGRSKSPARALYNIRWLTAAEANKRYAPGGYYETSVFARDGWRKFSVNMNGASVLAESQFTYWRPVRKDYPPNALL